MNGLIAARAQTGISLGFHIVFAALGVGLPLLMFIAEGLGLRTKDTTWFVLARRWSKAFAILFVVGAVSGTILSFEFGLLWPRFMGFATSVIGLPFALEGFMFFLEAIFLGLYLYGWDRLTPRVHWMCSIPLVVAGAGSAWFIVTVNSWMNTPAGFQVSHGQAVDVNPIAAIFNPSTPAETLHMLISCYEATGFGVAAVYALLILRGGVNEYLRRGLALAMVVGSVAAVLQAYSGDLLAKTVARTQPAKLAAMEGLFQTEHGAAEHILGWPDPITRRLYYSINIPHLLAWLAYGDPNATVRGLDSFPANDQPPVQVVHLTFDTMVGIGLFLIAVALLFWAQYVWRKRKGLRGLPENKLTLALVAVSGPLSFLAIELGWLTTEFGRQPWIIYNIMRVQDAVTNAPGLGVFFGGFTGVYILLGITTVILLTRMTREGVTKDERATERDASHVA